MKRWHTAVCLVLVAVALGRSVSGGAEAVFDNRYEDRIAKARQEFLAIHGRVPYRFVVDKEPTTWKYDDAQSHVQLEGAAMDLAKRYGVADLAAALWGFLDDTQYASDACACLYGTVKAKLPGRSPKILQDAAYCKWVVRDALNQPDYWYPHKVLFDQASVMRDRKDPAARRRNIEAMVKALADPKIRTENPLEVENIQSLLAILGAKEAAPRFVDYLFYDFRTGADYRIKEGDSFAQGTFEKVPGCTVRLAKLGPEFVPLVLDRLSRTTKQERSIDVGGGGAPVFALCYFYCLHITEEQAAKAIKHFVASQSSLTTDQVAALDELVEVVKLKKYRPSFFAGSWAAQPATNGVSRN